MKLRNILKNNSAFIGAFLLSFPLLIIGGIVLIAVLIMFGIMSLTMGFGAVLGIMIMGIGFIMIFRKLVKLGLVFVIVGIIFIFLSAYGIMTLDFINVGMVLR